MRHVGLEPTANHQHSPQKQQISQLGAAKASVAVCPPVVADDDLRAIADAWATLPPAMRAGILAMVRATSGK